MIDDFHLSVFGSSFKYFVTIKQEPKKTQNDQSDMYVTLKLQKNLAMTNDKGEWSYSPSKKKIEEILKEEIPDFGYLPTA